MRIRILSILAALLAFGGIAIMASPADAAGRFSYGADVKNTIPSRTWTQHKGNTEIQAACKLTDGEKFTITLLLEYDFGTKSQGAKTYTCTNKIQSQTWTGVPAGQYYFQLTLAKSHASAVHFSGNVFYP